MIYEVFDNLPRQGPGSRNSTAKAFTRLVDLPPNMKILDIGCGTGSQTMDLAQLSHGDIVAVDNHQPFIDTLNQKAFSEGLSSRVKGLNGDMFSLDFEKQVFDLIWAEGSVYIVGLETGLLQWKKFLKTGGYLVVSHINWIKDNPPQEVVDFWMQEYPDIAPVRESEKVIVNCGYKLLDKFVLPEIDWLEPFYNPLEKRLVMLREKYKNDDRFLAFVEATQHEVDMYKKYSDYYSYVFYVMQVML